LTAIAGLGTTGYAKRTAADTWALSTTVPWGDLTGVPSSFSPSAHVHAIADVTTLQTVLDGKAVLTANDFTGLQKMIRSGSSGTVHQYNRETGNIYLDVVFSTNNSARWAWRFQDAETGANAGGTLNLIRRADDGSNLGSIVNFFRDTGLARFQDDVNVLGDLIIGTDPGGSELLRVGGSGRFSGNLVIQDTVLPTLKLNNTSSTGFINSINTNNAGGFYVKDEENNRIFFNYDRSTGITSIGHSNIIKTSSSGFHLRGGTITDTTAFGVWTGTGNFSSQNADTVTTGMVAATLKSLINTLITLGVIKSQ